MDIHWMCYSKGALENSRFGALVEPHKMGKRKAQDDCGEQHEHDSAMHDGFADSIQSSIVAKVSQHI